MIDQNRGPGREPLPWLTLGTPSLMRRLTDHEMVRLQNRLMRAYLNRNAPCRHWWIG